MEWKRGHIVVIGLLTTVLAASSARADDRPIVVVSAEGVAPARLEVHVGEIVSWRSTENKRLRIELDDHPGAHEIIERQGQVRGVFRKIGEHSYAARLVDAPREARGVVVVKQSSAPAPGLPECAPESSERICFAR